MANQEHLNILIQGVDMWNQWRKENVKILPDLGYANLGGADLSRANLGRADLGGAALIDVDLSQANLRGASLGGCDLTAANLSQADLSYADLSRAVLSRANLSFTYLNFTYLTDGSLKGAILTDANLKGAILTGANFKGADLSRADLTEATLVRTNLEKATLTDCNIFGISAWSVELKGARQNNLIITPEKEPTITVDNLKIAQFIYLLLNNEEIRDVIDTIAKKAVLILGRFNPERKSILEAIREALRTHGYLPILFDFEKPASRDITETVSTLAHLARFVIADITEAKSIPQELLLIVPNLPSVAVQPIILNSQHEYGMFEHFTRFPWVLPVYRYADEASLLQSLHENVIAPAEQKAKKLNQS